MNAFATQFPRADSGGPVKRADFMMAEMVQGIEMIRDFEKRFQVPAAKPAGVAKKK